jgi:hypothetical protein
MQSFLAKHGSTINGVLQCFDRVIIRGHLPIAGTGYFSTWLFSKQISLNLKEPPPGWRVFKDAAPYFSRQLKAHAKKIAAEAKRPYVYLSSHQPMETNARALAEQDGITHGLVCAYGTTELCRTFRVRYQQGAPPQVGPDQRSCLVIYFYSMHRDFGLLHVKLHTWFPFTVQIYLNGHEWLARKLSARGIAYRKVDNAFTDVTDCNRANACARGFARRNWLKLLDPYAARVNPLLDTWLAGQRYYWVVDQAEFSTDVLFTDPSALETLRPRLYEHAALCFSAPQIMSFLGRRYRENYQGEVTTHWRRREPGAAVKHVIKRNALKMYDKDGTVLRIEPVINDPKEFFVLRRRDKQNGTQEVGWFPMTKGVVHLHRYAEVCQGVTARYLEALAVVDDLGVGQKVLDRCCAPVVHQGRKRRALQPLGRDDQALFAGTLRGEYLVRGFRNGELGEQLFGPKPDDPLARRRRCGRVSRYLSLLRAHGLLAKIPRSRRYRVTATGQRFMSTALHLRAKLFPPALIPQS